MRRCCWRLTPIATAAATWIGMAQAHQIIYDQDGETRMQVPGVGTDDSRGRLDPEKGPWHAVGKLQVATVNRRQTCTGTLIGPSTVLTAAHCVFKRRRTRPAHPR